MNYDSQQFAFSHGLATATPQLNLQQNQFQQQQNQFQQQPQHIFQQQYNNSLAPTSNIYQFQFAGNTGTTTFDQVFPEKDRPQMGVMGCIQTRFPGVSQPLVKQGVRVGFDIANGFDGVIYQQKNNAVQQLDSSNGMQQNFLAVDMMRGCEFVDQSINSLQNQGLRIADHNMYGYGKQSFAGWVQPQQISMPNAAQSSTQCQSSLPAFNNLWSPLQSQKQQEVFNQQQQLNNHYHQLQQFHHQLQPQQQQQNQQQHNQIQAQMQFHNAPIFQNTSNQRIKPQPSQCPIEPLLSSPLTTLNTNSSQQSNHIPQQCLDKQNPSINRDVSFIKANIPVSLHANPPSCLQPCIEHHPSTTVTYTISGPPKVTITLDSLPHSEPFPPRKCPDIQDVSFNLHNQPTHPHNPSTHQHNPSTHQCNPLAYPHNSSTHQCNPPTHPHNSTHQHSASTHHCNPPTHPHNSSTHQHNTSTHQCNPPTLPHNPSTHQHSTSTPSLSHSTHQQNSSTLSHSHSTHLHNSSTHSYSYPAHPHNPSTHQQNSSTPTHSHATHPHNPSTHFLQEKMSKSQIHPLPTLHSQTQRDWQTSSDHRNSNLSKLHLHSSSTGSSLDRSSSESSNFSSPPYPLTPPGSTDSSIFSPVHSYFPKSTTDISSSSGRTSSSLSSSSSSISSSLLSTSSSIASSLLSSQEVSYNATPALPNITTTCFTASSTCTTTSTAATVSSCNCMTSTTTSVITTTTSPKEITSIATSHALKTSTCISKKICQTHRHCTACGPVYKHSPCSCISEDVCQIHNPSTTCNSVHKHSSTLPDSGLDKIVKVPYSWQRKFENGVIVYLSPSGVVLQSLDQICHYLLSDSTCKCGLECPIHLEKFFSFDPEVGSQTWSMCSAGEKLGELCNHRREILALAAFHSSKSEAANKPTGQGVWFRRKRERKKSNTPNDGLGDTPVKRLKTNTVNKCSVAIGQKVVTTEPSMDSYADSKPVDLKPGGLFKNQRPTAFSSPQCPGGCGNHCDASSQSRTPSPRNKDFHICHEICDDKICPRSKVMQNIIGDEGKADHFGIKNDHVISTDIYLPHSSISSADNHAFCKGSYREFILNMQNHYPITADPPSNKHIMQYFQGQFPCQHQPTNPGMCFPNNHIYPKMLQQPDKCHHPNWQGSYPNNRATIPSSHHHSSRSFPSIVNPQHPSFNQSQPAGSQVDCTAAKSDRPKSKKDKQKKTDRIVDRSSPCLKGSTKSSKSTVISATSASIVRNPIVFVEQQAAIINNSISSCHTPVSSPSPSHCDATNQPSQYPIFKDKNKSENIKPAEIVKSEAVDDQEKINVNIKEEDDDEQKIGTDLESNKSFSDTVENNDSAYLSQTGSDQERSDILDRLDSCLEIKLKLPGNCGFDSADIRDIKHNITNKKIEKKSGQQPINNVSVKKGPKSVAKKQQPGNTLLANKVNRFVACSTNKKMTKTKSRHRVIKSNDGDTLMKTAAGNLNVDLSQLLASNNWNIPALQQVLANYSANSGQKGQIMASVQNNCSATLHDLKVEVPPGFIMTGSESLELKPGIVSTTICASNVSPVVTPRQPQPSFQPMTGGGNLISNLMQFQQLSPGGLSVNMLLSSSGNGPLYTTDSSHPGTFTSDLDVKSGIGAINPVMTQGIVATVSHIGDINSQIKLSVNPQSIGPQVALPPTLGAASIAAGMPENNTILPNSFGPGVIINAPMPPVSVSIVTNVTKSLAQVVPAIGINQTIFGAPQIAQHLLNSPQNAQQIINTLPATPGSAHILSPSPQLITSASQGTQFINPTTPRPQLVSNTPQPAQIMNTLTVGGFPNQVLITNPVQQISPSNSLPQLSPALTTQIITQNHSLPQISPSYLQNQILNQPQSLIPSNQNSYSNIPLPNLTITPEATDALTGHFTPNLINTNIQNNPRVCDNLVDKISFGNTISQVPDANSSITNSSMYTAANQPVFVIPQSNPSLMMQVLGSAPTSGDLNITQGSMPQLLGQSAGLDQAGIQNLLASGCSPLGVQQMNSININGVQQQQQLHLLQLQQLMLQQLQNQNINGISLPPNQTSNSGQATAIGAPAFVSTFMPPPSTGLQLSTVLDINTLQPCLSPVAQTYLNQLSPATAPLQHINPALAVQQVAHVNSCGPISVVQGGGMQHLMPVPTKHLQIGQTVQHHQLLPNQFPCVKQNIW